MMIGSPSMERRITSILGAKSAKRKRTIVVGLKSHNYSREMLLRLLNLVITSGDNVLAVHVQEPNDTFDPNTFHIHEDLCKSKQVDFQIKVCTGDSFIVVLTNQVRLHLATILALGCSTPWPKDSLVASCVKGLPPTCTLLVMDNGGRILVRRQGISQQGSTRPALQPSLSFPTKHTSNVKQSETSRQLPKSFTMPSSPTTTSLQHARTGLHVVQNAMKLPDSLEQNQLQRLALLEAKGTGKRFTSQELHCATDNFCPEMVIGEGGHSKVYRANLGDGQAAAVKVLMTTKWLGEELLREVEMLSGLKHEHIVQLIGYCYSKEMLAVVCNLLKESLKQKLRQLKWSERLRVAVGVAKALEYLHHSCSPPIIHRDVKSSNILLSDNCHPQLSDFGAAMVHQQLQQPWANTKPFDVVGTFGYLAPEYMMYGKVDEKIDVYSYGVVLLELITGKEAIRKNQASNHESLVLWARSLLSCGLYERLVDPHLNDDYNRAEMQRMIIAARLCLMHSSSRRPTMKMILKILEDPDYWLKMQRERGEFNKTSSEGESGFWRHSELISNGTLNVEDI